MVIYLIGFMGVGKSTVGSLLASDLGYEFVDTDELIESREAISISEIFRTKGEDYFRRLESVILSELALNDNIVVSCGGGIIKNDNNVRLMKESGEVVLLEAPADVILSRVKDNNDRPLLYGKKSIEGIQSLIDERQALYDRACTYRIDADKSASYVVKDITDKLRIC